MLALNRMRLSHQLAMMVLLILIIVFIVQFVYYLRYNKVTQDRARVYVDNIMNQVDEKLTAAARDIHNAAMTIAYDSYVQEYLVTDEPLRRMQLYDTIKNSMNYIVSTSSNICNIVLIDSKNRVFSLYSIENYNILNDFMKKYKLMTEGFCQPLFTPAFKESFNSSNFLYAYIAPVYSIAADANPGTKIGVCVLFNKIDNFQNIIGRISMSKSSLFLIKDGEGKVIASNRTDLVGTKYDVLDENGFEGIEQDKNTSGSKVYPIIQKRDVDAIGFQMVSILPAHEVADDIRSLRNFSIITTIAMSIPMMLISILFFRNITRPVSQIAAFLESINEGQLDKRLYLPAANEIGKLADYINKMLANIAEMTKKVINTQSSLYEMALAKKQTELSALQSQINPHFLYNTLNCIQSMALACGSMEIVNISAALVRIFRYSIKAGEIVKVREEIKCIKDYLQIMSIRYNGKFITEINVEDSILEMNILKMILQPIVENAIYHGLECKKGKGKLMVLGKLDPEGILCFEVIDDGRGMDPQTLATIKRRLQSSDRADISREGERSVGLVNINKRIKLYYGEVYRLEIDSRQNEGTVVKVRLPVKE